MLDKLFAILALAGFLLFVGVLAVYVNELNLYIVIAIGAAMGAFDFVRMMFFKKDDPNR